MVWAVGAPDCMATSATAGRSSRAIRSPTTNTSGYPGTEQSGFTRNVATVVNGDAG